jgi:hypothetical protein
VHLRRGCLQRGGVLARGALEQRAVDVEEQEEGQLSA